MNQIKVHLQQSIVNLHRQGWSKRKIARELGLDRVTVRKYLAAAAKSPTPLTGSEAIPEPQSPGVQTGAATPSDSKSPTPLTGSQPASLSKSPTPQTGSGAARSSCEPFRQHIEAALQQGLSLVRIYQDLVSERQFAGSYHAVRRFARKLSAALELPFRRLECEPGAEAQVDFGRGAPILEDGKRKRPHLFRVVLSHSRKGYSEAVARQTTESFIRALENAFRHFGGVVRTLVIDNLRAAVKRTDWFEPELNPKVAAFCEHYGTVILPCKVAMPRHKGKIEAGVKYVQNNALKGRSFESLSAQNLFLADWEAHTADTRIHGTTKKQVARLFLEVEKPALLPLPASLFPVFEEARRTVHQDGYIELQKAYYSVPPEYVSRQVWVRWEARLVRVFNLRMEQIAVHPRREPGKFATDPAHIHDHKRVIIERGADWLLDRTRLLGKYSGTWAEQMFQQRGPLAIRVLHGLLALAEKHPIAELERACRQAIEYGAWRLRDVRELLNRAPQPQLTFLEKHPLIRDLEAYDQIVPVCFAAEPATLNPQPSTEPNIHEQNEP